jgi:hypothetical protein
MFNAMALIHYEEMIERGVLPASLNDMPTYRAVIKAALRAVRRKAGKHARPRSAKKAARQTRKS